MADQTAEERIAALERLAAAQKAELDEIGDKVAALFVYMEEALRKAGVPVVPIPDAPRPDHLAVVRDAFPGAGELAS